MSHPQDPLVVGELHVTVGTEHGSSVSAADEFPVPARRLVPIPLPPLGDELFGREQERATLGLMIAPGEPVQIHGPEGVGKSTLLRRLAHDVAERGELALYAQGAGRELDDVLQDLFEACFDSSRHAPSRMRLRGLLGGISAVLLVDDLDCPLDQLREFLETGPGIALVFTSAARQSAADRTVELGGLDERAAFELLARELGRPLRADEVPVATALWETTGGRPLELIRAASAAMTPGGTLGDGPAPGAAVPRLYDRLGQADRSVLAPFVALPSALVSESLLPELSGVEGAAEAAGRLVRLGLLSDEVSAGGHRYRLAPGVDGLLPPGAAPDAAALEAMTLRMTEWAASPGTGTSALSAHADLLTGLTTATAEIRPDRAVRLARAAAPAMARTLRWGAWRKLLDAGLAAAERAGDRRAVAYFTHERGVHMLARGAAGAAAAFAAALLLWQELGDSAGAAITMHAQTMPAAPPGPAVPAGPATAPAGTGVVNPPSPVLAGTATGVTKAVAVKTAFVILGTAAVGTGVAYAAPPVIRMINERPRTVGCASVEPGRLDFSEVAVTATEQVRVTNTCSSAVGSITSSVSDLRFTVVRDACAGRPLPPRETCRISIRFTPAGSGPAEAVLQVVAGTATGRVTLVGQGVSPGGGGPSEAGGPSEGDGASSLAGRFGATGFEMKCPDSVGSEDCGGYSKIIKRYLSSMPPLLIEADPACTAPPCKYRLADPAGGQSPGENTGALTVVPEGNGYTVSDQEILARIQQITQAYSQDVPDIAVPRVTIHPIDTSNGLVNGFTLKAAVTVGGQDYVLAFDFTRVTDGSHPPTPRPS